MSGTSPEPAAPSEDERAAPSDFADLRDRYQRIGWFAWREVKLTAAAAWSQTQRLVTYVRAGWKTRRLEQRQLAAAVALGERLEAAQLGDAKLLDRLADLRERRLSFVAAKESTRSIDTECRGLYVRLAEPFLESVEPPAEVQREHRQALTLKMDVADRLDRQTERRGQLWPVDFATRVRTAIGLGLMLLLMMWVFSRFGGDSRTGGLLLPPQLDQESLEPLAAFPIAELTGTSAADDRPSETREFDVAADGILPARHVTVPLVNGVVDGEVRSVDSGGRLICIERYQRGQLSGLRQRYYPDGHQLFSELRFVDGVAQGTESVWFPDGGVAARTDIVDGVPHGDSVIYFENGRKCLTTQYVKGQPHGQRSHFRPDGTRFAVVTWESGKPVSQEFLQVDVTEADEGAIRERGEFSTRLVDHWE